MPLIWYIKNQVEIVEWLEVARYITTTGDKQKPKRGSIRVSYWNGMFTIYSCDAGSTQILQSERVCLLIIAHTLIY